MHGPPAGLFSAQMSQLGNDTHILMAEPLVPAWPGDPGRSQSMSDDPLLTFYWEVSQTDSAILL